MKRQSADYGSVEWRSNWTKFVRNFNKVNLRSESLRLGSAIVCDYMELTLFRIVCDLRSTIRDLLRSFAIIWKPALIVVSDSLIFRGLNVSSHLLGCYNTWRWLQSRNDIIVELLWLRGNFYDYFRSIGNVNICFFFRKTRRQSSAIRAGSKMECVEFRKFHLLRIHFLLANEKNRTFWWAQS